MGRAPQVAFRAPASCPLLPPAVYPVRHPPRASSHLIKSCAFDGSPSPRRWPLSPFAGPSSILRSGPCLHLPLPVFLTLSGPFDGDASGLQFLAVAPTRLALPSLPALAHAVSSRNVLPALSSYPPFSSPCQALPPHPALGKPVLTPRPPGSLPTAPQHVAQGTHFWFNLRYFLASQPACSEPHGDGALSHPSNAFRDTVAGESAMA